MITKHRARDLPSLTFIRARVGGDQHTFLKVGPNSFLIHGHGTGHPNEAATKLARAAGHDESVRGHAIHFVRVSEDPTETCVVVEHFDAERARVGEHALVLRRASEI